MVTSEIEKLDALGREYGLFIYAIHQCKDGWGAQWRTGDKDSLPYDHFTVYPTVRAMVIAETDRINQLAGRAFTFTEPIKVDTFLRVRDERYAEILRQFQPKHKSGLVL